MLGSHDTFTYLKPSLWAMGIFKRWWRTQCRDIAEQYAFGVRFFDIRVRWDGSRWQACHGLVDLNATWDKLDDICNWMDTEFPEALYRIVLEKDQQAPFWWQGHYLCNKHPNLWRLDIKKFKQWLGTVANNNQQLYNRGYKFALRNTWEDPAREMHGSITAKNFLTTDLRKEARRINGHLGIFTDPEALQLVIDSKDSLLFIDYCTNEYNND